MTPGLGAAMTPGLGAAMTPGELGEWIGGKILTGNPWFFLPFYHEIDRGFPVDFPQQTNPMRMGKISGIPSSND